jgi:hypothetical protein
MSHLHHPALGSRQTAAWNWRFTSSDALRIALEEYKAFESSMADLPTGTATGDGDFIELDKCDRQYRIMCQNRAINQGMVYIGAVNPWAWNLLHWYYRKGLWEEHKGWIKVVERLQMPRGRYGRKFFDDALEIAITALFFAVKRRQKSTS